MPATPLLMRSGRPSWPPVLTKPAPCASGLPREKRKLVVLSAIAEQFKPGRQYTEKEVNRLLGRIYEDFPYLRRLLIEYGFLERTASGSAYWRKE